MDDDVVAELSVSDCWQLLRSCEFGRLVVVSADGPDVFPVNFVVDHGTVMIRTGDGSKLTAISADPRVAFEVDGAAAASGEAWSVVLRGVAARITIADAVAAVDVGVEPWQEGAKGEFIRVTPSTVTGRSFRRADSVVWNVDPPARTRPVSDD